MAECTISISVEKTIHEGLQQALQQIWDDHRICVYEVSADWEDVSTMGESRMRLTGLHMQTMSK